MKSHLSSLLLVSVLSCTCFACVDPPSVAGSTDQGADPSDMAADASGDLTSRPDVPDSDMMDMMQDMSVDMIPDMCPCSLGCDAQGTCLGCEGDGDCPGGEVCDTSTNTCVVCFEQEGVDRGCNASAPLCKSDECHPCESGHFDETQDICVQCLTNDHCPESTLSVCDVGTNTCVACLTSAQCANDVMTPTCESNVCVACEDNAPGAVSEDCLAASSNELSHCISGKCVECRTNDDCKGKGDAGEDVVCDLSQNRCIKDAVVGSRKVGQSCVYDDACVENAACVQMTFGADQMPVGGYCLIEKSTLSGNCVKPWVFVLTRASQANATVREFCGVFEEKVSAEAVYNTLPSPKTCMNADDCGLGGACEAVQGFEQCTYACNNSSQCPTGCTSGYCF